MFTQLDLSEEFRLRGLFLSPNGQSLSTTPAVKLTAATVWKNLLDCSHQFHRRTSSDGKALSGDSLESFGSYVQSWFERTSTVAPCTGFPPDRIGLFHF